MNEYLNLNLTSEHIQVPLQHKLSSIATTNVMDKRAKLQSQQSTKRNQVFTMAATESKDNRIKNILNNFQPVGMYNQAAQRSSSVLKPSTVKGPVNILGKLGHSREASRSRQSDRSLSNGPSRRQLNERVQQLVAKSYTSEYMPEQPYTASKKEQNQQITVQQNNYEKTQNNPGSNRYANADNQHLKTFGSSAQP